MYRWCLKSWCQRRSFKQELWGILILGCWEGEEETKKKAEKKRIVRLEEKMRGKN